MYAKHTARSCQYVLALFGRMREIIPIVVLFCNCSPALAQSPDYPFVRSDDPVQDRNAYLLTLINSDSGAQAALAGQIDLIDIGKRLSAARSTIIAECTATDRCPIDRLELTDDEIESAGETLAHLAMTGGPLVVLVRTQMRPSGRFQKYAGLSDDALIRAAWHETAIGVNRLYRIYGLGEPFVHSSIDGMTRDPKAPAYRSLLTSVLRVSVDGAASSPFFAIWERVGFDLLAINQRDEAGRYEPLQTGENAAPMMKARKIDWAAGSYTAIVVPGVGLEEGQVGLSPLGAIRIRMAAKRWRDGLAPFIIVSGGAVHPNRTPYTEAIEMKHALLTRYGVPASAVVIDPYARHTTTNLRNAARLLFRMGAPMNKPVVIIKLDGGVEYILSQEFARRCDTELGYQPMTHLTDLSTFEISAIPNVVSLEADPSDPLDP
jgi:hypothetical protein